METVDELIRQVTQWAASEETLQAIALVGSWARGTARGDSDVDLVILAERPGVYLTNDKWIDRFGKATKITTEDWGAIQSKRVFYKNGLEVEFGLAAVDWARISPVDKGTAAVVRDGIRILYDKTGILRALVGAINASTGL
jgi:predicted nucleotidyltransferase